MITCTYCPGQGPKPGWIEMDDNGPIAACPVCNPAGETDRAWDLAEMQRDQQNRQPSPDAAGKILAQAAVTKARPAPSIGAQDAPNNRPSGCDARTNSSVNLTTGDDHE